MAAPLVGVAVSLAGLPVGGLAAGGPSNVTAWLAQHPRSHLHFTPPVPGSIWSVMNTIDPERGLALTLEVALG